ncbi:Cof-type HAD-IIB family hydrolase [Clostridium sp. C105KSO13]|uniref:Cof-type HAD-IIB family hydrolase n=1 Tax=Clostridium sp. C105KSO13 TaxID=1776045 RepID=UPI0007407A44|nr:Cof-type HAD-IIB family hydrolase [Clostridium sp. C105KSO13]CUX23578.1 Sugar phosphatase YidA [Clostridium sp. C105KSO13]
MKHQIKMIGLDLDGTLLNEKKEILPYTRRILNHAIERGIIVLAATGRPLTGIPEELRFYPDIRYAITSNGARVMDIKENKPLIERLLPIERGKKALETFRKYDTLQEVYFDGQGYAPEQKLRNIGHYHHDPNMWEYVLKSRKPVQSIMALIEHENKDMDKVQAIFADSEEQKAAWAELEKQEGIVLVTSLGYNIEINASGVNKGTALVELGKMLGIRREEIMACGDRDNDIDMLKEAGLGVAMGNAEEEVKNAADYITLSNIEEGAAKAIEQFALS